MTLQLLIPLGLLGLLGLLVLLLIYIIKPNYLVRHVSSTYVWKLSLKYRRKKIPTSTIRNILLFICQVLILTAIALILAKPALVLDTNTDLDDVVAIIDSSASMYTRNGDDVTRFERAVRGVKQLTNDIVTSGGTMNVILADEEPDYLGRSVTSRNRSELDSALDALLEEGASYGSADIAKAITLSEEVLVENPAAKIYLYTDVSYQYVPDVVTVVPVSEETEWNAAILDAKAEFIDGYYTITAQVACYGRDAQIEVFVSVKGAGANDESVGETKEFSKLVPCSGNAAQTVVFRYQQEGSAEDMEGEGFYYFDLGTDLRFSSYRSINIYVQERDSFLEDNTFNLYGGTKEVVKIQYYSAGVGPNPFFTSGLDVLRGAYSANWDIRVDEVHLGSEPAMEGYNFYIFEHAAPERLPTDGIVFLVDPDRAPAGSGLRFVNTLDFNKQLTPLEKEEEHPLTTYMTAEEITVSRFNNFDYDTSYTMALSCRGLPILLVRNEENVKIAVLTFSLHYSNIALTPEWFILLYNMFGYFFPATVDSNAYEVREEIKVNARGPQVEVNSGSELLDTLTEFPATLSFRTPGTYTLRQSSYFEDDELPDIELFIKTPAIESDIWHVEDALAEPFVDLTAEDSYRDLLIWLAAALVALIFVEWWLQSRENK